MIPTGYKEAHEKQKMLFVTVMLMLMEYEGGVIHADV
jgi:hypothetical protein